MKNELITISLVDGIDAAESNTVTVTLDTLAPELTIDAEDSKDHSSITYYISLSD